MYAEIITKKHDFQQELSMEMGVIYQDDVLALLSGVSLSLLSFSKLRTEEQRPRRNSLAARFIS